MVVGAVLRGVGGFLVKMGGGDRKKDVNPEDPSVITSSIPMIKAVERGGEELTETELNRRAEEAIARKSLRKKSVDVTGQYQALPVKGPITRGKVISHNISSTLAIEEPGDQSREDLMAKVEAVITEYRAKLETRTYHHLGYPYNLDFDYGPLDCLQKFSINNLGDPFIESNYGVHSREFELGVLQWFARLWEVADEEYWGYITNCGTEGNLHGILVGRENLPDGVLYASRESHYSVFKAARMYRMDAVEVSTLETGEINYDELRDKLIENRARPAILNVNIGTTVKGAVDDLDKILDVLKEAGYPEERFFIHCDGALFGLMIPFVKRSPMVTFKKPIGSVSVSGHKFVGSPVPCGVVMTKLKYVMALSSDVEYLNSRDCTIMGSRNGHAAIYMWYTFSKKGYEGVRADVEHCMVNARHLKKLLERVGVKCFLNELSSTVVFERPEEEDFIRKWQLACEGPIAHVIVMPNVSVDKLEEFVEDLVASRARMQVLKAREAAKELKEEAAAEAAAGAAAGAAVVANGKN